MLQNLSSAVVVIGALRVKMLARLQMCLNLLWSPLSPEAKTLPLAISWNLKLTILSVNLSSSREQKMQMHSLISVVVHIDFPMM